MPAGGGGGGAATCLFVSSLGRLEISDLFPVCLKVQIKVFCCSSGFISWLCFHRGPDCHAQQRHSRTTPQPPPRPRGPTHAGSEKMGVKDVRAITISITVVISPDNRECERREFYPSCLWLLLQLFRQRLLIICLLLRETEAGDAQRSLLGGWSGTQTHHVINSVPYIQLY